MNKLTTSGVLGSALGRDVSITNFAASSLYSGVKLLRFLDIFPFLQIPILVGS